MKLQQMGGCIQIFFLVNHLLNGLGGSQAWFTTHDPAELVKEYGCYLHGNEFAGRRVVLSEEQQPDHNTLRIHEPSQLLVAFLEYFKATCTTAAAAKQPVLLCIFAHGETSTYNVYVGESPDKALQPQLKIRDLLPILDANHDLELAMMMTSCFSGGWAVIPDQASSIGRRRTTAMTAAGADVESESWPASRSLGRCCGSLYVSAILNTLQATTDDMDPSEGAIKWTTEQFASEISNQLLNVVDPRFGTNHDHQFSVQNDEWEQTYQKRTGFPLTHYRKRLSELQIVSARSVPDMRLNRSAITEQVEESEKNGGAILPRIAMGRFGGNLVAVKKQIQAEAMQYMRSHPGRDSTGQNMWVHSRFKDCIERPKNISTDQWEIIWGMLHYRQKLMHVAQTLVYDLLVYIPADQWDQDDWFMKDCATKEKRERLSKVLALIWTANLLPKPANIKTQGRPWIKPSKYLAAALIDSGLDLQGMEVVVQLAERKVRRTVENYTAAVKSTKRIKFNDGTWWTTLKEKTRRMSAASTSRSLSPMKRLQQRSDSPGRSPQRLRLFSTSLTRSPTHERQDSELNQDAEVV